ncbi:MAG: dihydropteroate synthase [Actinobacteria bacterium 69-20]|nr:MAG: dihydropteroate synthase [Actinobacteria bacterium 69-20]
MTAMLVPAHGPTPWVIGVVNVTPDSFSDGGKWLDTDAAIAHGLQLVADGAAIVDVGGESTRPGAHRVDAATERARVVPVIAALTAAGVTCSVDTSRAAVAEAAIDVGVAIVNDVSGGMADPDMARVVAAARVPWILMHWRGPSDVMQSLAHYGDVVADVTRELRLRVDAAVAAGVDERSLILDPGLGFAKEAEHNWEVLRRLDELVRTGWPILIGASRKRFLGSLLAGRDGTPRPPDGREIATAAISLLAAEQGVWAVRVHDARSTADALAVASAMGTLSGVAEGPGTSSPAVPLVPAAESPRVRPLEASAASAHDTSWLPSGVGTRPPHPVGAPQQAGV